MDRRTSSRRGAVLLVVFVSLLALASGCDKARNDSIALVNQGVRAYNAGEPETASHYFSSAVEVFPQNDLAHYHLGLVHRYDHDNLDKARAAFAEAYRINPYNTDASFQLATMYFEEGKLDTAQTRIEQTIQGDPQNHQAHYQLGRIMEAKQKYREADTEYRRAITLYPLYPPAFNALAVLYMSFDELDAAVTVLREGIRLNPDDVELHANLGLALMEAKDWDGAIEAFGRARSIEPLEHIYLFNLGLAFERAGDTAQAIRQLNAFIERSSTEHKTEAQLARAVVSTILKSRDARTRARHLELPEPPPPEPPLEGGEAGTPAEGDAAKKPAE